MSEHKDSKEERLAEEIRKRFSQLPTLMVLGQVATQEGKELLSDAFIYSLITRIGKAVVSGECPDLDKVLGVVGRGKADASSTVVPIRGTCYLEGHIETDDEEFMNRDVTDLVDIPIIALRKEEKKGGEW